MKATRKLPAHALDAVMRGRGLRVATPEQREPSKPRRGVMNKTEMRYSVELQARKLAGEIRWFAFEPITLRLASGAKYTPDFAVLTASGALEFHETKGGFIREAAMVRLKVAASLYPFRFVLVQFVRGEQITKEIRP